ncbi:MAG: hypothetical protein H6Q14_725 [Bacteroidetes bacterium]|nr:hypothetical protein [Bacteroidota bacterium]
MQAQEATSAFTAGKIELAFASFEGNDVILKFVLAIPCLLELSSIHTRKREITYSIIKQTR